MPIGLFCTGDSITAAISYVDVAFGDNLAHTNEMAPGLSYPSFTTNNFAIPGYMISDLVTQAPTLRAAMTATGLYCVLTVMIGHNDLEANRDPITDLPPYLDSMRSSRVGVGLCTILPSSLANANTKRAPVNVAYLSWVGTHCDFSIDLGNTSTVMGNNSAPLDTNLYQDGIHPAAGGRELLAPEYATSVNAFFETIPKSNAAVFGRF